MFETLLLGLLCPFRFFYQSVFVSTSKTFYGSCHSRCFLAYFSLLSVGVFFSISTVSNLSPSADLRVYIYKYLPLLSPCTFASFLPPALAVSLKCCVCKKKWRVLLSLYGSVCKRRVYDASRKKKKGEEKRMVNASACNKKMEKKIS